jgi:hypothetical protein
LEFDQHLGSHKHVINLIMWFRDMGCYRIQTIAHVSHLGRFLHGQWDCLTECVLQLDGRLESLGLGHDQVWGELGQGLLQLLELCRCQRSISSLTTLPVAVKSTLDVSPDGDGNTWPWHHQDQVGVVRNCYKLGECQPSQESIIRSLKIGDLKLYGLRAEIFRSSECHRKSDLADGGRCYTRDYAMEGSPTGA